MELSAQIKEAVRILKKGGVVAYPTDTVYGLGASMDNAEAVERVFTVKSRPRSMALPVLVGSIAQIEALAGRITPATRCLIRAFLPGAMTLVLPASALVPEYLRAAPLDIYSGQPLIYKRTDDGRGCMLYSVGENQLDDGGRMDEDRPERGDVLFWPVRVPELSTED